MGSKPPFDLEEAHRLLAPIMEQLDTVLEQLAGERMGFMVTMWTDNHDMALGNVELPMALPAMQHIVNEVLQGIQTAQTHKERLN